MKINFEEIRKQNWDEGENRLYEIIKNYEQNDLAALAVNYFNDLCTKRIESEILKAENELLRKHLENYVQLPCQMGEEQPHYRLAIIIKDLKDVMLRCPTYIEEDDAINFAIKIIEKIKENIK